MYPRLLWLLAGLFAFLSTGTAAEPELEPGFVSLFNGRDLAGWHLTGGEAGAFEVHDGELECTGRGQYPAWLRTDETYENFILRFEFKLPAYNESNVLIHAPLHGDAARVGMAIKLCEDTARGSKALQCGGIVGVAQVRTIATEKYDIWNRVEVLMDWPVFRVTINGKAVQDLDCSRHDALRYRLRNGYIGLQSNNCRTSWRNISLKVLPSSEQWIPLFNGRDLTGWHEEGQARWSVRDGVIHGTGSMGYIVSERAFQDFELFTYVRTGRFTNGGIFYRWKRPKPHEDRGYEIQIYNCPDAVNPTGSIYGVKRADVCPARDGEWFPMQIFVHGRTTVVCVNGVITAIAEDLDLVRSGPLALQSHSDQSIEFKDVRVKLPE